MSKKSSIAQTVSALSVSMVTLRGQILEESDKAFVIRCRRPRTSRYNIITVPKDKNLVAAYGTPGDDSEGQIVVRKSELIYSAHGIVTVNKDGSITVAAEGDHSTTFYPEAEGVTVEIIGEEPVAE